MDFRDKKKKSKKSHYEEEEAKHLRIEKRKTLAPKKGKDSGSELTAGLLSSNDRSSNQPKSFFGNKNQQDSDDPYNYNNDNASITSSSVNDKDKSKDLAAPIVPEDYTWDFVVVLPVGLPEEMEGEELKLPALEPSEVCTVRSIEVWLHNMSEITLHYLALLYSAELN
jgi:hypothetical protein